MGSLCLAERILCVPTEVTAFPSLALGSPSSFTASLPPSRKCSHLYHAEVHVFGVPTVCDLHGIVMLELCSFTLSPISAKPRSKTGVYLVTIKIRHLDIKLGGSNQVK